MASRQFMDFTGPPRGRTGAISRPVVSVGTVNAPKYMTPPPARVRPAMAVPAPSLSEPVSISATFTPHATPTPKAPIIDRPKPTAVHTVSVPRQNKSAVLKRQAVKKSAVVIQKATRPKRKIGKEYVILVASFVMFISGAGLAFSGWQSRQPNQAVAGVVTPDIDNENDGIAINNVLKEAPPTLEQYRQHNVNIDQPRYLRIPDLSINARVRRVGLDQVGQMQLPASIFDAAWYKDSALPGSNGVALIGAHALGQTKRGIFHDLQSLKVGNIVEIEKGNGVRVRYSVIQIKPFTKLDLEEAKKPPVPGIPALNLVTLPSPTASTQQGIIVYTTQMATQL